LDREIQGVIKWQVVELTRQLIMIKRHLLEAEQKGFWYASGKESQILPQEVPYGIVLWNGFAFK
jgi:hypothetical protein